MRIHHDLIPNNVTQHNDDEYNEFALIAKISKLNVPTFDGSDDPLSWICQIEQCFDVHRVSERSQILMASLIFEMMHNYGAN